MIIKPAKAKQYTQMATFMWAIMSTTKEKDEENIRSKTVTITTENGKMTSRTDMERNILRQQILHAKAHGKTMFLSANDQ